MVNVTIKYAIESYTENQHLNRCVISRKIPGGDDTWTGS